jgi:16S rRNA (adenine1518-N6/adenine1519-N6)-dimethyltransferase
VSDLARLPPLREVIERHELWARKSLGQNFLLDANLVDRIARAAGGLEGHLVYEVGPGPGGLTRALLRNGAERVVAVEKDPRCIAALQELSDAAPGRLTILEADALEVDPAVLLAGDRPIRIVANLPYNVGTQLLLNWLTAPVWPPFWASLTLMFQKEVAQRIIAKPGTAAYGRLSVLAGFRAKARLLFDVPPRAFTPPPKVTSSIVHLEPSAPVSDVALPALEAVTKAAFGQRRKMLRAALKGLVAEPTALLAMAEIDGERRAETLTLQEFCRLASAYQVQRVVGLRG